MPAAGFRAGSGSPLLTVGPPSPLHASFPAGVQTQRVELFGAVLTAHDCGSVVVTIDGALHDYQCAPITYQMLDLVHSGVTLTDDLVKLRGRLMSEELRKQATDALAMLGPRRSNLTIAEAELHADILDLLNWIKKDVRFVTNFGRDFERPFSALSWNSLRLILACCAGPGHALRLYCVTGPAWSEASGWTAYALVYRHHCVPMRMHDGKFAGEEGGSLFLRHALAFGIAPIHIAARSWQEAVRCSLATDAAVAGGVSNDLVFPAGVFFNNLRVGARLHGLISRFRLNEVVAPARAGRTVRVSALGLLTHRLAPSINNWVGRWYGAKAQSADQVVPANAPPPPPPPPQPPFVDEDDDDDTFVDDGDDTEPPQPDGAPPLPIPSRPAPPAGGALAGFGDSEQPGSVQCESQLPSAVDAPPPPPPPLDPPGRRHVH